MSRDVRRMANKVEQLEQELQSTKESYDRLRERKARRDGETTA